MTDPLFDVTGRVVVVTGGLGQLGAAYAAALAQRGAKVAILDVADPPDGIEGEATRVWRADVAFPVSSGARASWTIRFTNIDRTAFAFRDARDVAAGRELTVPSSIFAWP